MAKHIKKAQGGTKQPTPTYKNLRLGVANKRRELGLPDRDGYGASSADSAFYRFGFGRGLRGEPGYPGEPELQKMGRWEGQNVNKKKPPSKKTGGKVKKAQMGMSLPAVISNKLKEVESQKYKKGGTVKAKGGKQMLKRADGSYSQRGLWDNIRANRGSGKKPTAAMLKQERKIKAKSKK